jgi:hypothetical protein
MQVLRGEHAWLEQGTVGLVPPDDVNETDAPVRQAAREPATV